jgi:hypothetical protein
VRVDYVCVIDYGQTPDGRPPLPASLARADDSNNPRHF